LTTTSDHSPVTSSAVPPHAYAITSTECYIAALSANSQGNNTRRAHKSTTTAQNPAQRCTPSLVMRSQSPNSYHLVPSIAPGMVRRKCFSNVLTCQCLACPRCVHLYCTAMQCMSPTDACTACGVESPPASIDYAECATLQEMALQWGGWAWQGCTTSHAPRRPALPW
jgi:hypothetical protein